MSLRSLAAALFVSVAPCAAQAPPESFFSVPPSDAPELAARGAYSLGVRTLELKNVGQIDILSFDRKTGTAPLYDRPLTVEVWYPAVNSDGRPERTRYEMGLPGPPLPSPDMPKTVFVEGKALRDAEPQRVSFPLVIVSHGYPGSRYFLSYLSENLASKGYVVAAIDHTDSVFGAVKPFASTLLNREKDQLLTIRAIEDLSRSSGHFLNGIVDPTRVAIIGYSMGGYGALASAGAAYSGKSMATTMVPGGYFDELTVGHGPYEAAIRKTLKAIVAIAPWGAQPPYNLWDAEGLAGLRIPLLMIAGDQDDIADFRDGIRPAFDKTVNSERCLLVYENARHNVGGNPPPPETLRGFTTREFFDEPVWRKDRITAINQHFVTAFLDLHLKGLEARRAFLHPSPERSNDGQWPLAEGESAGAQFSNGKEYWKGFQRRWAVGLEMRCSEPAR